MRIIDDFNIADLCVNLNENYALVKYDENIFIGIDKESNVCVVTKTISNQPAVILQTRTVSVECNVNVDFKSGDSFISTKANIIKCFLHNDNDKDVFLELAILLINASKRNEHDYIETFKELSKFFEPAVVLSESELIGLYAELYTVVKFKKFDFGSYWQSKDKMKFDFSFSDTLKLEVKCTTKPQRIHHFKHEQLVSRVLDIYVLSFMLREDDKGLSLYDLLIEAKKLLIEYPTKLYRVEKILKDEKKERLETFKYNKSFTETNMHFYKAKDIPRFNENTPSGVSNAEYDCILDNIKWIDSNEFIDLINNNKED